MCFTLCKNSTINIYNMIKKMCVFRNLFVSVCGFVMHYSAGRLSCFEKGKSILWAKLCVGIKMAGCLRKEDKIAPLEFHRNSTKKDKKKILEEKKNMRTGQRRFENLRFLENDQ